MSETHQPAAAPPERSDAPERRRVDWSRVNRYAVRLTLTLVVAGFAVWTLAVFGKWRPVAKDSAKPAAPTTPVVLQMTDFFAGQWTFAESQGAIGVSNVDEAELAARLAAPPMGGADSGGTENRAGGGGHDDARLLALFRDAGVTPERRGACDVYQITGPSFRAVGFATGIRPHERLVGLRLAIADGQGKWLMLDLQSGATQPAAAHDDALLPFPSSVQHLGTRRDRAGHVRAQMLTLRGSVEPLLSYWRQQGVQVDYAEPAQTTQRHLRCLWQGAVWHAWLSSTQGDESTLLVVREPASEL